MRSKVFSILTAALLVVTGLYVGGALLWASLAYVVLVLVLAFAPPLRKRPGRPQG